jgi:hypothetical protein
MYVVHLSIHDTFTLTLFSSTVEEKALLLTAYRGVLKFIPKLKDLLPYKDNADAVYIYKVIEAVCGAHIIPCGAVTMFTRCKRVAAQPAPIQSGG